MTTGTRPGYLRCDACGHEGRAVSDVNHLLYWVGGHGQDGRTWCINKMACWARQEAKNSK